MVVLMCRDPGDATSKVSCCVEPSWCFKVNLNLKSASFIVIMHLHECLTHIHSQKKPRLLFGESFTLTVFLPIFSQEREEHRVSGDERRRRNDQPEERRSRWESDRPRERDRGGERHRERDALASQQAERQQHDERRRENRQRREETQEQDFGRSGGGANEDASPPVDKEKPNFELSGALTEDTNTFRGVVIKYNEPPEARIPKRRWRLYPFKNDEPLPVMYIHRQSAYLLGRQRKIADIPIDHPSCSKQHAVFQYR